MLTAYLLCGEHEVTVYEANDYIGGHTNTIEATAKGTRYALDTGFIVFNQETYPNFIKLMHRLDVPCQTSDLSFSVSCDEPVWNTGPPSWKRCSPRGFRAPLGVPLRHHPLRRL